MNKMLPALIAIFLLVLCSYSGAITTTTDPLDIVATTRPLGMGNAFIAAADDANSIFLNPAGLSYAHNWGLTSGTTSMISDVTYTSLGVYWSTGREGYGLGLVGANTWKNIVLTYIDPVTGHIVAGGSAGVGYSNYVLLLSYGVELGKYFNSPLLDRTSFGVSFKSFFQQLSATDETFSANGIDLDIGLIYKANSWLKFGIYGQNILPSNLRWNTGIEEEIPANYKSGLSMKLMGEDAIYGSSQDLYFNLDAENSFIKDRPTIFHTGLEWWPLDYLAIRLGVDQEMLINSNGTYDIESNFTSGLGIWSGDFGLDYTYHQYGPLSDNLTHYFSISYGFPRAKESPETKVEKSIIHEVECLVINTPVDKSAIYEGSVIISGEITSDKVSQVDINGDRIEVPKGNRAIYSKIDVPAVGKFTVIINCLDDNMKPLKEYKIRLFRMPSFSDVPENFWARDKISLMASLKIFGGYSDDTFKPNKTITRAELSGLLAKASGILSPEAIDNPASPVNRAEGVVMISRFAKLKEPDVILEGPFPDLPGRHWAAKTITAAKADGLLNYLSGKQFEPKRSMTRAEAAEIISRTELIKEKESELYDWEAGFE